MKIIHFWKPALWLAIIIFGMFLPSDELPGKQFLAIPHFDKIVHFSLFFVLSLLLFRPFKKLKTNYLVFAPLIAITIGAALEIIQNTISPTRYSDYYDFIANTTGAVVSIAFYYFLIAGKKWEILF